ncbi:MAG TPA: DUF885 domain-containing protein [Bryobacteraceae bacterium]|nr:DUF885 domain-containing protein [Bryobacteraceae bacterium]
MLNILARYAPEDAASLGISGLDDKISIPSIDAEERARRDTSEALRTLRSRLTAEPDPLVKQDLEILIAAGERENRSSAAREKYMLPYDNAGADIFRGIRGLLDDQIAPERRQAAVIRLRRYTGLEQGYTPTTQLAEAVFREKLKTPGLLGPAKAEVEHDLTTTDDYITGIGLLLEKYKMTGYAGPYAKMKEQLTEYNAFIRKEILPRARTDFRLPPELYAIRLENFGVDYTPQDLTALAHRTFIEIQGEMQPLAASIAKTRHLPSSDYRDVIRELKKEQIPADQVMSVYHDRLAQIEAIIRREQLITLPARPCIIRLASAAETAQQPAPHMLPPPLIGNHGEQGQFVLPGGTIGADGKPLKYDDFTFSAAAWTLTAHEARPGHELQFASMVERGVSQARAIYAQNSTNVEGWGLYSEWFLLPYMPDEGKLISLQHRLMRAARAFVDPELQQGKLTPAQALAFLQKDVVLSKALATEEVDRYTFRSPGQAVSYFDGYSRLREIRAVTEKALGPKFNARKFHDFILSQGLLPPNLLREAVMNDFVR